MKKILSIVICTIMIVSALIYATGCQNRERILSKETEYEETHMKKMKMKIVECINNNDRKGLKKLFSKNAIEEVDDLDARIDKLLEVFSGKSIVSTESEPVDSSRTNDYGKESISIYGEQAFKLKDGKIYAVWIDFCDKDDNNKDNVGLYMIEVCTCSREELPEKFTWEGVNSGNPGIFIHYID